MNTRTEATEPATPDPTLLVLLAQSGDRAALEQLLRDAYAPLRRYITRLAGAALADDILQETSLQIFRKLPFLREPAVFRAWTFQSLLELLSRILNTLAAGNLSTTHRRSNLSGQPHSRRAA